MTVLRVRLRFRGLVFYIFISVLVFGPIVGGMFALIADRLVLIITLYGVGKDLKFV